LRLPVSRFRRCHQQQACDPKVPRHKEETRQRDWRARSFNRWISRSLR